MTARSDLQLYALDREDFLLALTGHAKVQQAALDLAQERLAELGMIAP